ncbi:MAG: permease [Nitrospirae bacterium]|nr:MAG: permease [Nitrospirota bacterium]
MNISLLVTSGLEAIYDYVLAHTLFCLVPAFFIAGAMAALIPKDLLLPYLGKNSPKHVAYPISVVTGLLLAVCSCTVLPLFAGIRKGGAGIGPAIAFLYTAPATNIVAILYTGSLIGWDIAFARIFFSILFAVVIGIIINSLFHEDTGSNSADAFAKSDIEYDTRRLFYFFSALIGILLAGTRISDPTLKYSVVGALIVVTSVITKKFFTKDEVNSWMNESWGFAKTIAPLLLAGVFVSGIIKVLLPQEFVVKYVGSNSLSNMIIPVIFGVLVYFPTLVEVPMAKVFIDLGMAKGPLLAYLLADPVLSLPSILVVSRIMGAKRTAVYATLIMVLTVSGGYLFGLMQGK